MSENPGGWRFRAFISYQSRDRKLAEWLHRRLERYKIPRSIARAGGQRGPIPRQLKPIFRDRDDASSASDLDATIARHLAESEHLIVLCTPPPPQPTSWVWREIELFRELRPGANIYAVIDGGKPEDCLPGPLITLGDGGRPNAPLAADLRKIAAGGDGPSRAVVKLVAGLAGVNFDDLWRRDQRRKIAMQLIGSTAACLVLLAIILFLRYNNQHNRDVLKTELDNREEVVKTSIDDAVDALLSKTQFPTQDQIKRLFDESVDKYVTLPMEKSTDVQRARGRVIQSFEDWYEDSEFLPNFTQSGKAFVAFDTIAKVYPRQINSVAKSLENIAKYYMASFDGFQDNRVAIAQLALQQIVDTTSKFDEANEDLMRVWEDAAKEIDEWLSDRSASSEGKTENDESLHGFDIDSGQKMAILGTKFAKMVELWPDAANVEGYHADILVSQARWYTPSVQRAQSIQLLKQALSIYQNSSSKNKNDRERYAEDIDNVKDLMKYFPRPAKSREGK